MGVEQQQQKQPMHSQHRRRTAVPSSSSATTAAALVGATAATKDLALGTNVVGEGNGDVRSRDIRKQQRRETSDGTRSTGRSVSAAVRRRCNPLGPSFLSSVALVLVSCLLGTTVVEPQQVGVDICACQPATYEFVFDFDLTCDDSNVGGPGINASACVLNTDQDRNVTDFTPVIVTRILILELNQNFEVIAQTPIVDGFTNGQVFRYTSVIAGETSSIAPEDIPKGLQLSMAGRNGDEEDLVNFWLILYDNNCGVFPVVLEGQRIGWTIFGGLSSPPVDLCPLAAGPPSQMPLSESPSESPSASPSVPPALAPPTCPPFVDHNPPDGKGKGKGKGYLPKMKQPKGTFSTFDQVAWLDLLAPSYN